MREDFLQTKIFEFKPMKLRASWKIVLSVLLPLAIASNILVTRLHAARQGNVKVVNAPPLQTQNEFYTSNRAPLQPAPLIKLPIGAITPRGWLRHQLELESSGMTGHLEEISKWCKFENSAWASSDGQGQFGW